jgi:hypothetical protein
VIIKHFSSPILANYQNLSNRRRPLQINFRTLEQWALIRNSLPTLPRRSNLENVNHVFSAHIKIIESLCIATPFTRFDLSIEIMDANASSKNHHLLECIMKNHFCAELQSGSRMIDLLEISTWSKNPNLCTVSRS